MLVILAVALVWHAMGLCRIAPLRVIAHGIEKGRIGATLGRLNLNGMKSSPGKSHHTVFHRPKYPQEYGISNQMVFS